MKVRPKMYAIFQFCNWKCVVSFKPQQKWDCEIIKNKYNVSRNGVEINLTEEEFRKYFREVQNETNRCG